MGFAHPYAWWPNSVIPYEIADDILVDNFAREAVDTAIDEWNHRTNIRLIARTRNEKDYAIFRLAVQACSSTVGRQGGPQYVNCKIDPGAGGFGVDL